MSYKTYSNLILISDHSDASSLEELKTKLEDFYKKDNRNIQIILNNEQLCLKVESWTLYINYSNEKNVLIESKEIANQFVKEELLKAKIASCKGRFEMFADPDPNMDFFNDSCFVIQAMESFKEVFVFDTNNSSFTNI